MKAILDKDLGRRNGVLFGHVDNGRVIHTLSSSEGSVGLDGNVVLGASGADTFLSVERMDFDLVDHRRDTRVGGHELLDLESISIVNLQQKT